MILRKENMSDFKVILTIFVIASVQSYYACYAQQNSGNQLNRTSRHAYWTQDFILNDGRNRRYDARTFSTGFSSGGGYHYGPGIGAHTGRGYHTGGGFGTGGGVSTNEGYHYGPGIGSNTGGGFGTVGGLGTSGAFNTAGGFGSVGGVGTSGAFNTGGGFGTGGGFNTGGGFGTGGGFATGGGVGTGGGFATGGGVGTGGGFATGGGVSTAGGTGTIGGVGTNGGVGTGGNNGLRLSTNSRQDPASPASGTATLANPIEISEPFPREIRTNNSTPCNRQLPTKPNFRTPGVRISDSKCDEYHWDLKNLADQRLADNACRRSRGEDVSDEEEPYGMPVVGGRDSAPGEFPHMGAIGWRGVNGGWVFKCGGTIVSEKFLMTAAHCSSSPRERDPSIANSTPELVRFGVWNLNTWPAETPPTDVGIQRFMVFPQYRAPSIYFDIALVELRNQLDFSTRYIRPACLWNRNDFSNLGTRAFVTGWGLVDEAATETSASLQVAEIGTINNAWCDELLQPGRNRNFNGIMDHQLCAGAILGGVDACQGDSGGPLQVKVQTSRRLSYIIGVTSFGRGCARPFSPGVYTRVSSFIDWIESNVWPQ